MTPPPGPAVPGRRPAPRPSRPHAGMSRQRRARSPRPRRLGAAALGGQSRQGSGPPARRGSDPGRPGVQVERRAQGLPDREHAAGAPRHPAPRSQEAWQFSRHCVEQSRVRLRRRRRSMGDTCSRNTSAAQSNASARFALCARSASMSTGSGSNVPMWVSRRALADWVTLIASRRRGGAEKLAGVTHLAAIDALSAHPVSCTTSSASVALARTRWPIPKRRGRMP